jgi:hypothetical protein
MTSADIHEALLSRVRADLLAVAAQDVEDRLEREPTFSGATSAFGLIASAPLLTGW